MYNIIIVCDLFIFSRRVPDAICLLATSRIDGEIHVERRYAGHSMHTVDDDFQ